MSGAFARRTVDLVLARRQQAASQALSLEMIARTRDGRRAMQRAKRKAERAERKGGGCDR